MMFFVLSMVVVGLWLGLRGALLQPEPLLGVINVTTDRRQKLARAPPC
jgi:hypothetical protein